MNKEIDDLFIKTYRQFLEENTFMLNMISLLSHKQKEDALYKYLLSEIRYDNISKLFIMENIISMKKEINHLIPFRNISGGVALVGASGMIKEANSLIYPTSVSMGLIGMNHLSNGRSNLYNNENKSSIVITKSLELLLVGFTAFTLYKTNNYYSSYNYNNIINPLLVTGALVTFEHFTKKIIENEKLLDEWIIEYDQLSEQIEKNTLVASYIKQKNNKEYVKKRD